MSNVEKSNQAGSSSIVNKLPDVIKTTRIQTALVTTITLWLGYLTVEPITVSSAIILLVIGVLFHVFGFTMNEIEDYIYDSKIGNGSSHPIANGDITLEYAKLISALSIIMSIGVSLSITLYSNLYSIVGTIVLMAAVLPGVLYNKFSKTQWWSNIYLSIWSGVMVISGAMHAGSVNNLTIVIAVIVSIQIFVQVIQGDLKDLHGDEESFCRRMGVDMKPPNQYIESVSDINTGLQLNESKHSILTYPITFAVSVYGLKIVELFLILYVIMSVITMNGALMMAYTGIMFVLLVVFSTTLSMFMVYVYDRDRIKKYSSMHELTSVIILGMMAFAIQPLAGVLVGIAPIVWYVGVNKALYSDALNPDV